MAEGRPCRIVYGCCKVVTELLSMKCLRTCDMNPTSKPDPVPSRILGPFPCLPLNTCFRSRYTLVEAFFLLRFGLGGVLQYCLVPFKHLSFSQSSTRGRKGEGDSDAGQRVLVPWSVEAWAFPGDFPA